MKGALRIIIFVVVMGTVSGTVLLGANSLTARRIARNEELRLKSAVLEVLEVPYSPEDILKVFAENVEVLEKDGLAFYRGRDRAVAFQFKGPGLWGPIEGIISLNPDQKTLRVLKILHQEETPGLGARIAEKDYLTQFKNKAFSPRIVFTPQGKAFQDNEVDAITGATGSSRALEKLLNESIQNNLSILKNA